MSQAAYGIPAEQIEKDYLNLFTANSAAAEHLGDMNIGRKKRL